MRDEEGVAYNYRKELADMEIQLKKQQNLYHAVRNDKNILNKGLTEAHDEISDLKGKLRVLNHQFDQVTINDLGLHWFLHKYVCVNVKKLILRKISIQLKEEIETKEAALTNVNKEQAVIVREKEDLATEVERGMNSKAYIE